MHFGRRNLLQAAPLLAAVATVAAAPADTTDLVLACNTTLGPAMRAAAARFAARSGVRVHVFPTPPGLILPQLAHEVQNDIVVTGVAAMQRATDAGFVAAGATRGGPWRNRLVLAARHDAPPGALQEGPIAAPDPTPASDIDGPAVLARMGLQPQKLVGAIDANGVLFLLATGAARVGLVHATDLHGDPPLDVVRAVPDDAYPPIVYAAAVSQLTWRPNPDAFVKFLATDDATALLHDYGLEVQS